MILLTPFPRLSKIQCLFWQGERVCAQRSSQPLSARWRSYVFLLYQMKKVKTTSREDKEKQAYQGKESDSYSPEQAEQLQQNPHKCDSPRVWRYNILSKSLGATTRPQRQPRLNTHTHRCRCTEEGGTGREQGSLYGNSEDAEESEGIKELPDND